MSDALANISLKVQRNDVLSMACIAVSMDKLELDSLLNR